jgi:dihydrofolate reductase
MGKLVFLMSPSLDGYIADEKGNFDWSEPDEVEHHFVNDVIRPTGTFLFGRKVYETMRFWETALDDPTHPEFVKDFARIYGGADKVVYSRSMTEVTSPRTRLERDFDPDAVRSMKAASDRDIGIGGPTLAARAIEAGLIDEYHVFVCPVIVGGGTRMLQPNVRLDLRLLDEKRFKSGRVYLRYEPA